MLSVFCAPARYVQGRDASSQLGLQMQQLGLQAPAFIIAGRHAREHLSEVWRQTLAEHGFARYRVELFGGECSNTEIERLKRLAREASARVIIGAGGGKVLDTARALAFDLALPVVNCPSVASSDAPCSALSVLYTDDGKFQEYRFYKRNPDLVLVDTSLIARGPERLLSAGMGDALATWFEARTVKRAARANQLGGRAGISAEALSLLCYQTLLADGASALQAVRRRLVTPALERLVEANTLLSGLGFESGGLAVAHSVHNGLTIVPETHNYYHGEKVAFGLLVQLVLEGETSQQIEEVLSFSSSVNLPVSLQELGICSLSEESLLAVAERALAPGETAHNEPFAISTEMLRDAILAADALGSAFLQRKDHKMESAFCLNSN